MGRAVRYFVLLALLTAAAVWFADRPGRVAIEWQGYRVDASFAILLAAAGGLAIATALAYRLWILLRETPARLQKAREESRRRKGYLSLTRGMVAVAAGDAEEAQRHVRRADALLGEPPLTMLLSAQAAQLAGDEQAAGRFFSHMLERPETEFLGVRGLLAQALKAGDWNRALDLARRAYRLKPGSEWVAANLFTLEVRKGEWVEAGRTLDQSVANKLVSAPEGRRRRALLEYQIGIDTATRGEKGEAMAHMRRAHDLDPHFVPVAQRLAKLLVEERKHRKAAGVIEDAWTRQPHPSLLEAYCEAREAVDAVQRVQATERLAKIHPGHAESLIGLAQAAVAARLWGEARKNLEALPPEHVTARVCRLWADLEEAEHGDTARVHEWLLRASAANPDPAWVCRDCGHTVAEWTSVCVGCGSFDTLSWRMPPHAVSLTTAPAPSLPVSADTGA